MIFLKSRRGVNFAETSLDRYKAHVANIAVVIPPGTAGEKAGEQLITDRACTACHKLGDADGGIAPDLSYEGLIRDDDWLMEHFQNPRSRVPDSIMPAFRFPAEDFQRLTAYLGSLKTPSAGARPPRRPTRRCARAATARRATATARWRWYLDPSPRDFTKAAFMTSKPRERFLESIHDGVAGTSMPPWGERARSRSRSDGVLDYVLHDLHRKSRHESSKPRKVPEHESGGDAAPASISHGEQIFLQRCTGCHGRKADGKGPNSLDILPQPAQSAQHVVRGQHVPTGACSNPFCYGVQGTAMPAWIDYGLTQNDVGDIMNFIRSHQSRNRASSMPAK